MNIHFICLYSNKYKHWSMRQYHYCLFTLTSLHHVCRFTKLRNKLILQTFNNINRTPLTTMKQQQNYFDMMATKFNIYVHTKTVLLVKCVVGFFQVRPEVTASQQSRQETLLWQRDPKNRTRYKDLVDTTPSISFQ